MFKHLLKLIWNKKKQNSLLISEILFSFMVIFAVFSFGVYAWDNYKQPMGMDYEKVWVVNFGNVTKPNNGDSLALFYETVKRNVKSMPEVAEVSYISQNVPFSESTINTGLEINGKRISQINEFTVDDNYLQTLNVKMLSGRWYNKQDAVDGKRLVVINRALKEKAFGSGDAIGKFLSGDDRPSPGGVDKNSKRNIIGVKENNN